MRRLAPSGRGRKASSMKPIHTVVANRTAKDSGVPDYTRDSRSLLPKPGCHTILELRLRLQPPANRARSISRAILADTPAPGSGGVAFTNPYSRLEEATREWLNWRFEEES